uniref:Uncharacterized protein n=1 Tax=Cacopsylla melanoneura TaxID=428564 RepID=A0A8D8TZE9_9HEMI
MMFTPDLFMFKLTKTCFLFMKLIILYRKHIEKTPLEKTNIISFNDLTLNHKSYIIKYLKQPYFCFATLKSENKMEQKRKTLSRDSEKSFLLPPPINNQHKKY